MTLLAPAARLVIVSNTAGDTAPKDGLALHVQVGNGVLTAEFNNPAAQASSTWQVMKDGTIYQFVPDPRIRCWAQGYGNVEKCSVETEGYPGDPLTPPQVASLGTIYRFGHDEMGWPYALSEHPGEAGFGWHGEGCRPNWQDPNTQWGDHPYCPGDVRKGQRTAVLAAAQGQTPHQLPPGAPFTFYNGGQHLGHPYPWDGARVVGWLGRTMTLHPGSTGGPVKVLQSKLGLAKDGVFGPGTATAVMGRKHGQGFAIGVPDPGCDQHSPVVDWRLAACLGPAGPNDG